MDDLENSMVVDSLWPEHDEESFEDMNVDDDIDKLKEEL